MDEDSIAAYEAAYEAYMIKIRHIMEQFDKLPKEMRDYINYNIDEETPHNKLILDIIHAKKVLPKKDFNRIVKKFLNNSER